MFIGRKKDKQDSQAVNSTENSILKNLLLVVDGSEPSLAAARFAIELCKQTAGQITAMYVVDTATMDYLMQMHIFIADEKDEFERDLENTGNRYLEYVSTLAKKSGLSPELVLEKGSFHQSILKKADELNVDAIVVGGWKRSITRKDNTSVERQLVLDETERPVIVIKK